MQVLFPPWAALGVSNSDPYAGEPDKSDDWVKEGPHLMIVVPDSALLEGMSTDPNDPVYVMWGDTPYAGPLSARSGQRQRFDNYGRPRRRVRL